MLMCRRMFGRAILALLTMGLMAGRASAHGQPAELEFWGGFRADEARCQRLVSRATSLCVSQVTALRSACLGRAVAGGTCDETQLATAISAAKQRALVRLERSCTVLQLKALGYIDLFDAQRDVGDACRQLDDAATSAAFGPVMVGGTVAGRDETTAACVRVTAGESTRLLRYAMRTHQQALDRIAGTLQPVLPPEQKQRLIDWSQARIARARAASADKIAAVCSAGDFADAYGRSTQTYLADIANQASCMAGFVYVQNAVVCPAATCGNGVKEKGEECDDGNEFNGDGCRTDCVATECDAFPSTMALIQKAIFENHGCTNDACHGAGQSGGLDLRAGSAYASLVDQPWSQDPLRKRIEPGDPQNSILFLKLAAKTSPDQYPADELGIGTPMPSVGAGLSADELEAVRRWIYAAATETGSVPGVGDLLNACTPEPEPLQIKPLDPPPVGEGVQLHMPRWIVKAKEEHEICFSSYYDFTDQVPAELRGPNDTFCYNEEQLRQDPLSHHLIVSLYVGSYGPNDPSWGAFRCTGGPKDGESCVATDLGFCGVGFECATAPQIQVGCSGVGPPDPTQNSIQFTGAQQPNASNPFPDGAYRCIPLKGMLMWNSHAFNLTDRDGDLQAWINFRFAKPDERKYQADGIFNLAAIFKMSVPAFQQQEVCNVQTFAAKSGGQSVATELFELTSHTHSRGKRWRTFLGEFTCAGTSNACDPLDPTRLCGAGVACTSPDGSDPQEALIYTNFVYNDPVHLRFDPPLELSGNRSGRSLTYCSLYDNGFTDPSTVKLQSTSPVTPFGTSTCPVATHCTAGKPQAPCSGATTEQRHRSCDSTAGAGDGLCDACTLNGGVTTTDEMFLLLGSYYRLPK
ncbi:MAG: DUF4215 domain-containing protein [bacterium]